MTENHKYCDSPIWKAFHLFWDGGGYNKVSILYDSICGTYDHDIMIFVVYVSKKCKRDTNVYLFHSSCSSLPGNGITGGIPKEFGNLTNLSTLNLGNNNLSGEIPMSLGNLTKLQFLTLSGNNLNGTIPESLSRIPSLSSLYYYSANFCYTPGSASVDCCSFTGNHLNCSIKSPPFCASESGDTVGSKASKIGVILGIVGGCIAILLLVALLLVLCRGRNSGYKREVFVDVAVDQTSLPRKMIIFPDKMVQYSELNIYIHIYIPFPWLFQKSKTKPTYTYKFGLLHTRI
ncbi:putative lrr receptor-like serine/threonine-protein kinase [Quercus suber]|uniref:Lrr receptor-like serine/threonine-protein kinase n=1 Tax=Quercus suber TaxID=58331 RepID=A0AAW0M8Q8_QUESU